MIYSALKAFLFFTLLTGIAYPMIVTGIAQTTMKHRANGSLIVRGEKVIGSELIGQKFESPSHFHSRPSATDYNPLPSGGSNLGPVSADLKMKIEERKKAGVSGSLLYASASGLDPDIFPEDARIQVDRIVQTHRFSAVQREEIEKLILRRTQFRDFRILGEERVNVVGLNLDLDEWIETQPEPPKN